MIPAGNLLGYRVHYSLVRALGFVENQDSQGRWKMIQAPFWGGLMIRTVLTDAQWEKMEPHCLGKKSEDKPDKDACKFSDIDLLGGCD